MEVTQILHKNSLGKLQRSYRLAENASADTEIIAHKTKRIKYQQLQHSVSHVRSVKNDNGLRGMILRSVAA